MILTGARVALGPEEAAKLDVEIRGSRIAGLRPPGSFTRKGLDLAGHLIVPGLINAHDHLEFALFPRLGKGPYRSAGEWARDIYHPDQSPIREQLRVPKSVRLVWGGLRNLLAGVTVVCHHNPYAAVFRRNFPVRVLSNFGWAHSLEFSPDVARRFHGTPSGRPFILHLGEATDGKGRAEIFRLNAMGALDGRCVLVHAVAFDRSCLQLAREKGASLIWCPTSNLFTLGTTLGPAALRSGLPVALGTDSPLTAAGDLLDELRAARRARRLSDARLYRMVTAEAARVLRLDQGAGGILKGGSADLAIFRGQQATPAAAVIAAAVRGPEMVIVQGSIKLVSSRLAAQLPQLRRRLLPLAVEGRGEFLVDADIPNLYQRAARETGPEVRLGGKRINV